MFKPRKVDWLDKGRKDLSEDRGRECLKYLKRGGIEKREGGTNILKEGGEASGSRGGCLKKGAGLEPP